MKPAEKMSCYLCVRIVNHDGVSLLPHDASLCSVDAHATFAALYTSIAPEIVTGSNGLVVKAVQLRSDRDADMRRTNEIKDVCMNIHETLKMVRTCNGFDAQLLTFVVGSGSSRNGSGGGRAADLRSSEPGMQQKTLISCF